LELETDAKETTMLRNPHRARPPIAVLAVAAIVVGLAACGGGESLSSSSIGAHATPGEVARTVVVFDREPASPSPSPTTLHAGLEEGQLPAGAVEATVLTDEDCAPDAQGISHCRNEVQLASGQTVVLRHPHNMQLVPCLAPGEEVLLRRA
jgi:hypothetical protein